MQNTVSAEGVTSAYPIENLCQVSIDYTMEYNWVPISWDPVVF